MIKMDMNVKSVITNSWKSPVNMSRKKDYFFILHSDILWKLPPPITSRNVKKHHSSFFQLILVHLVPV